MKHLKLKILLIFICISTSSIIAQNDSVKIAKKQVKNIYIGLKQSEAYKANYDQCLQYSDSLAKIIVDQDQTLQRELSSFKMLQNQGSDLSKKITANEVEIQRLKSKKTPWYRHPILYGLIGFATGIYLVK